MAGQFAGYLTAGGLQKGPLYGRYQQYGYRRYSGKLVLFIFQLVAFLFTSINFPTNTCLYSPSYELLCAFRWLKLLLSYSTIQIEVIVSTRINPFMSFVI